MAVLVRMRPRSQPLDQTPVVVRLGLAVSIFSRELDVLVHLYERIDRTPEPGRALTSVESFFDVHHPDVFVHLRNESVALAANTAASDIMLSIQSPVLGTAPGYSSLGSLAAGSGYWSRELDLPVSLVDHKVRTSMQAVVMLPPSAKCCSDCDRVCTVDPFSHSAICCTTHHPLTLSVCRW